MKNVFIQVGLSKSFEYHHLCLDDFLGIHYREHYREFAQFLLPPEVLKKGPFCVVGIDMNPDAIAYHEAEQQADIEEGKIVLLNKAICGQDGQIEHGGYNIHDPKVKGPIEPTSELYLTEATTLDRLFSDITESMDCEIIGCGLDIEGAEIEVFENFTGDILPAFFQIEAHTSQAQKICCHALTSKGYVPYEMRTQFSACHIKFLHETAIDETKSIWHLWMEGDKIPDYKEINENNL